MNDSSSECRIKYDRIKLLRRFALYFINSNTKLLGFVILIITILVLDSCSKNVLSFIPSPDDINIFLPISIAITASMATLIGLVTLSASIDIQHRVQKARELFWSIKTFHSRIKLRHKEYDEKESAQYFESLHVLSTLLYEYKDVYTAKNPSSNFILNTGKYTIIFISLVWLTCFYFSFSKLGIGTKIYFLLLLCSVGWLLFKYYQYLISLEDFSATTGLPSFENILDASTTDTPLGIITVAKVLDAELVIAKKDDANRRVLLIRITPPMHGFRVFTWFSYYNVVPDEKTKLTQDNLIAEEIFYYKTRKKDTPGLEYSANYPVAVIRLPNLDDFTYVSIRMELISPQGRASLTFERLLNTDLHSMSYFDMGKSCTKKLQCQQYLGFDYKDSETLRKTDDKTYDYYLTNNFTRRTKNS